MAGDIVAFIRARLDEDDHAALRACYWFDDPCLPNRTHRTPLKHDHWVRRSADETSTDEILRTTTAGEHVPPEAGSLDPVPDGWVQTHTIAVVHSVGDSEHASEHARYLTDHIARHDPARAFHSIRAKRRILTVHCPGREVRQGSKPPTVSCAGCGFGGPCDDPFTEDINECPTLMAVASEWPEHPDYRTEWTA